MIDEVGAATLRAGAWLTFSQDGEPERSQCGLSAGSHRRTECRGTECSIAGLGDGETGDFKCLTPSTSPRRAPAPRQGQGRDRLAHRLRLYLALHEGADALDGRSRFRKDPRPDLPGVRHPRPYFEFDLTSGGAHPLRHAY